MTNTNRWKGFVLAVIAAALWGVSGTCCQFLFQSRNINTEWLVTVRLLISGIILLAISFFSKKTNTWEIWKDRKDTTQLILFSILGMVAVQYTYFAAIKHSNAATATILQYAGPALIAIYIAFRKRKWPSKIEFTAVLLAIAGTFLLVTHGSFNSLSISPYALFWGLASAVALAFYSIYPVQLLNRYPAIVIIGWSMTMGGIAFSFVHAPWDIQGIWDGYTWLYTAFVILLGSLVAFCAYLTAVKIIGAQVTSLLASAEPLSAALIAVIWLSVVFGPMDWLGCVLILCAIFLLATAPTDKQISSS